MRFVWDYERYMEREQYGSPVRAVLIPVLKRFRAWDVKTATRPSLYVANSTVVADRIKRFYGRDIADPSLYDLVINATRFGVEACAALIVGATRGA